MRTVLFHRDFQNFTGGHLKMWNYFNHVEAAENHRAQIYFSPGSRWDDENPWLARRAEILPAWEPAEADALFLGGFDWNALSESERDRFHRPVINLIQHVHHGDAAHPLSAFLRHRAVRICVSEEVRAAIETHGGVNGPAFVIPDGIDLAGLPAAAPPEERPVDWLICGLKTGQPAVARELARRLDQDGNWGRVETLTRLLPRADFLSALASARGVVLLPRATEGFYLPALEAMALDTLVICPDCVGNRSFCRDGDTALVPSAGDADNLLNAMRAARALEPSARVAMIARAHRVADAHSLARERGACHELLAALGSLW